MIEERYAENFVPQYGRSDYLVRMALGALIIQNRRELSDRELVEEVMVNAYMQYFVGLQGFTQERPFDNSTVYYFRERFSADIINEVNEMIVRAAVESQNNAPPSGTPTKQAEQPAPTSLSERNNEGTLLLDATCVPADIRFPTDPRLLTKTREALEEIVDVLWQPLAMYQSRTHTTPDRIVSLHMPVVRPIVRGEAGTPVEFGAKLAISNVNGYTFMEHLSFGSFHEGVTLMESVENYKRRFGRYPQAVIADNIYRNRDNIAFCKSHGIRLSGPPLGRPTKDEVLLRQQRREEKEDARARNRIEAVCGVGKRFYGLGRILTRLRGASETVIDIQLMVMNLARRLCVLCAHFLRRLFSCQTRVMDAIVA